MNSYDLEAFLANARLEALEEAVETVLPQVHGKPLATFLDERIEADVERGLRRFEDHNPAFAARLSDYLDTIRGKKPPG